MNSMILFVLMAKLTFKMLSQAKYHLTKKLLFRDLQC